MSLLKDIVRRNNNEYLVLTAATYHSLKILSVDLQCMDPAPLYPRRVTVRQTSINSKSIVCPLQFRMSATDHIARMGYTLPPPLVPHRRKRSARVSPDQEASLLITFLHNRSCKIFQVTFLHRICRLPLLQCIIININNNSNSSSNHNISNRHLCSSNSSILVV